MVFSSILFLFVFFPIVLFFYYLVPMKWKNGLLLVSSLFFYAWGEPIYILLLLISTYVDYLNGRKLQKCNDVRTRKKYLMIALLINLSLLGFFKYGDFLITCINTLFSMHLPLLDISLPIGISFYTFQTMSYSIDVYRKRVKPEGNYFRYLTYVSMFPQLIAGPIVRYHDIQEELSSRVISVSQFTDGGMRFLRGLFKKVLLANPLGLLWNSIFLSSDITLMTAWLGIVAFALQLYFDFAGYSDMAIGIGKMLGFTFPENFNYPYIAQSITDFWRRWHMTLSRWFRDYVYIPLGGNRVGKYKWIRNLMIVWMLTGLWHGASLNFLLWGAYFGVLLVIEKLFLLKKIEKWNGFFRHFYTLFLVLISFVLFAIPDMESVFNYFQSMIGNYGFCDRSFWFYFKDNFWLLVVGILLATPFVSNLSRCVCHFSLGRCLCYIVGFVLTVASLVSDTYNPFLYFRF